MADLIKILNESQSEKKTEKAKTDRQNLTDENSAGDGGENANGAKREKTTDELFIQYQVPAMENNKLTPEERDSIFNAVSKPSRRKHGTLFSR